MNKNKIFLEIYTINKNHRILINCITNFVTINQVANVLSAINVSPLMSHNFEDIKEVKSFSNGMYFNIGTLDQEQILLMTKIVNDENINFPIGLDPVGAGATKFRRNFALQLLNSNKISVIRGNYSELKSLLKLPVISQGIDSHEQDNHEQEIILKVAQKFNCIAVITGKSDYVSDGKEIYQINNGHVNMTKIIGTGCMLSSILTAFVSLPVTNKLLSVIFGLTMFNIAGQLACNKVKNNLGNLYNELLNQLFNFDYKSFIFYEKITKIK